MGVNPPVPEGQMLISGVEKHDDEDFYRIFIGPRWRWRYIKVSIAEGEVLERAFNSTYHLFGRVPEDAERFEVPEDERPVPEAPSWAQT